MLIQPINVIAIATEVSAGLGKSEEKSHRISENLYGVRDTRF